MSRREDEEYKIVNNEEGKESQQNNNVQLSAITNPSDYLELMSLSSGEDNTDHNNVSRTSNRESEGNACNTTRVGQVKEVEIDVAKNRENNIDDDANREEHIQIIDNGVNGENDTKNKSLHCESVNMTANTNDECGGVQNDVDICELPLAALEYMELKINNELELRNGEAGISSQENNVNVPMPIIVSINEEYNNDNEDGQLDNDEIENYREFDEEQSPEIELMDNEIERMVGEAIDLVQLDEVVAEDDSNVEDGDDDGEAGISIQENNVNVPMTNQYNNDNEDGQLDNVEIENYREFDEIQSPEIELMDNEIERMVGEAIDLVQVEAVVPEDDSNVEDSDDNGEAGISSQENNLNVPMPIIVSINEEYNNDNEDGQLDNDEIENYRQLDEIQSPEIELMDNEIERMVGEAIDLVQIEAVVAEDDISVEDGSTDDNNEGEEDEDEEELATLYERYADIQGGQGDASIVIEAALGVSPDRLERDRVAVLARSARQELFADNGADNGGATTSGDEAVGIEDPAENAEPQFVELLETSRSRSRPELSAAAIAIAQNAIDAILAGDGSASESEGREHLEGERENINENEGRGDEAVRRRSSSEDNVSSSSGSESGRSASESGRSSSESGQSASESSEIESESSRSASESADNSESEIGESSSEEAEAIELQIDSRDLEDEIIENTLQADNQTIQLDTEVTENTSYEVIDSKFMPVNDISICNQIADVNKDTKDVFIENNSGKCISNENVHSQVVETVLKTVKQKLQVQSNSNDEELEFKTPVNHIKNISNTKFEHSMKPEVQNNELDGIPKQTIQMQIDSNIIEVNHVQSTSECESDECKSTNSTIPPYRRYDDTLSKPLCKRYNKNTPNTILDNFTYQSAIQPVNEATSSILSDNPIERRLAEVSRGVVYRECQPKRNPLTNYKQPWHLGKVSMSPLQPATSSGSHNSSAECSLGKNRDNRLRMPHVSRSEPIRKQWSRGETREFMTSRQRTSEIAIATRKAEMEVRGQRVVEQYRKRHSLGAGENAVGTSFEAAKGKHEVKGREEIKAKSTKRRNTDDQEYDGVTKMKHFKVTLNENK